MRRAAEPSERSKTTANPGMSGVGRAGHLGAEGTWAPLSSRTASRWHKGVEALRQWTWINTEPKDWDPGGNH